MLDRCSGHLIKWIQEDGITSSAEIAQPDRFVTEDRIYRKEFTLPIRMNGAGAWLWEQLREGITKDSFIIYIDGYIGDCSGREVIISPPEENKERSDKKKRLFSAGVCGND